MAPCLICVHNISIFINFVAMMISQYLIQYQEFCLYSASWISGTTSFSSKETILKTWVKETNYLMCFWEGLTSSIVNSLAKRKVGFFYPNALLGKKQNKKTTQNPKP